MLGLTNAGLFPIVNVDLGFFAIVDQSPYFILYTANDISGVQSRK